MNTYQHVQQLAPTVGDTFSSRDLMSRLEACTAEKLFRELRELASAGLVKYTGKTCIFERLK